MRRFGLNICDRCGKRIMEFPTWILRASGEEERILCEACAIEVRDEIDGHEKASLVAMPVELGPVEPGF